MAVKMQKIKGHIICDDVRFYALDSGIPGATGGSLFLPMCTVILECIGKGLFV